MRCTTESPCRRRQKEDSRQRREPGEGNREDQPEPRNQEQHRCRSWHGCRQTGPKETQAAREHDDPTHRHERSSDLAARQNQQAQDPSGYAKDKRSETRVCQ